MAQYITTSLLEDYFSDYSFGTSGTDFMTENEGTRAIERASKFIDFKLQGMYGTFNPLFGTNSLGTGTVPQEILDITADLTMGIALENRSMSITPIQHDFGTMLYQRAMEYLNMLAEGEGIVAGFKGTVASGNITAKASGNWVWIYGETVTLTGTSLSKLDNRTILKGGARVYTGTDIGTSTYAEGTDYTIFYFGDTLTGTNYGQLYRVGTNITSGETVRVDYRYKPGRIFYTDDYPMWGQESDEDRK